MLIIRQVYSGLSLGTLSETRVRATQTFDGLFIAYATVDLVVQSIPALRSVENRKNVVGNACKNL